MKIKRTKILLSILMCTLLSACQKTNYVIQPTGTNETAPITTYVPAEYLETTVSVTEVSKITDATKASERMSKFVDLISTENVYVDVEQAKTVGDSVESIHLQYSKTATGCFYKYTNASGELLEYVVADETAEYLVDTTKGVKYKADIDTFAFVRRDMLLERYAVDLEYSNTHTESLDGVSLVCDTYNETATNTEWKYYYDSADNLMLIQKNNADGVQNNTLWHELRTTEIPVDAFDLSAYTEEKYIV